MQTLELSNYGAVEMDSAELVNVDGGGPWWYELGKAIIHSASYDAAKAVYAKVDSHVGPNGGSGGYHDIMSSSNHGGIR